MGKVGMVHLCNSFSCQAVSQLVMAVVHCHRRGVAHRDTGPQG